MAKRLLISFAHPDDESFGVGGTIARYVDEGVEVYLLCATNGDAGEVPEEMLDGYESVVELRLAELDCAAEKLGLQRVFKLGYKDSGMKGSETLNDPDCLWQKWHNSPDEITRQVVEVIRQVRPQVVITFNEYGGYGHPDHIAIHRATMEAFKLVGDPDYVTAEQKPYQPQKLYYHHFSTLMLRIGIMIMRLQGKNPRKFGRNEDIDLQAIVDNVQPAHAKINIRNYYRAWQEASACHVSQGGGTGGGNLMMRLMQWWQSRKQGFTRVHPAPKHDKVDEDDLFDRVILD